MRVPLVIAIALAALFLFNRKKGDNESRGIRNNNRGNIRANDSFTWQGQIGKDSGGFAIFDTQLNGDRAAYINGRSYVVNGFDTITKFISRWAPATENKTDAYIRFVTERTGIGPQDRLVYNKNTAQKLLSAIFTFETGIQTDLTDKNITEIIRAT